MSRWEMSIVRLDGSTVRTSPRAGKCFAQLVKRRTERISDLTGMNRAQHHRGILAPEGDAVRYCVLEIHLARMVRDVIEVAFRIGLVHVDCRWRDAVPHRQQRR